MTDNKELSIATGANLTQQTFADFVDRLKFHCNGEGVEHHCTADAIFIVQAKKIISGIDKDFTDKLVAHYDDCQWFSPKEYWDSLSQTEKREINKQTKVLHDNTFLKLDIQEQWDFIGNLDGHTVTGWKESWEYVCAHFTKEAAEAFIARKRHDYRNGLRVYVEAQIYCWEFNAIKNAIIDGRLVFSEQE